MKALTLLALAVLSIGSAYPRTITGEIYIRTKSGDTLLGTAISVSVYQVTELPAWKKRHEESLKPFEKLRDEASARADDLDRQLDRANSERMKDGRVVMSAVERSSKLSNASLEARHESLKAATALLRAFLDPAATAPAAVTTCITDSKGVFSCEVPDNTPVLLVARFERTVGGESETSLWCVPPPANATTRLLLNNTNTGDLLSVK